MKFILGRPTVGDSINLILRTLYCTMANMRMHLSDILSVAAEYQKTDLSQPNHINNLPGTETTAP